ncbi:MAG: hypothetical protein ACRBF0_25530, partial [Calditrichia bacterium]
DFVAQFPAGSSIPAGEVLVIAFSGLGFETEYGFKADYEIIGDDAGTPDMALLFGGPSPGITNGGESAVLFFWDGATDLVTDVDAANIGTPSSTNDIGDKSAISVDGPDADTIASTYLADALTMPFQAGDPGFGFSTKRIALEGANEVNGGGNGITGDDETTENIAVTWDATFTAPDPGTAGFLSGGNTPPAISGVARASFVPASGVAQTVTATVTDDGSLTAVRLVYSVNGTADSLDMTNTSGATYSADLPSASDGDAVEYLVRATDNEGEASTSSSDGYFAGTTSVATTRVNDADGINVYNGLAVRMTGVATVATDVFSTSNLDFNIQDATGGINIFDFGAATDPVARGDELTVEGELSQFNGKLQLGGSNLSYTVNSNGNPLPAPMVVTPATVDEAVEGMLISLVGVDKQSGTWPSSGNNGTVYLTTNGVDSAAMFIDRDTNVDEQPEPSYPIDVVGIGGQF